MNIRGGRRGGCTIDQQRRTIECDGCKARWVPPASSTLSLQDRIAQ